MICLCAIFQYKDCVCIGKEGSLLRYVCVHYFSMKTVFAV